MKKALLIAAGIIILICTYSPKDFLSATEFLPDGAVYEVYCKSLATDNENFEVFDNGSYKVGRSLLFEADTLKASAKEIAGERISLNGDMNAFKDIRDKLKIKVVTTQNLDGIYIEYGFSPLFSDYIETNGRKINVELSFSGNIIMLASPINLGGY